jgi:protein-S-isoprenylcysteine O-methyltransferase Ste14
MRSLFTWTFLIFMGLMTVHRFWETLFRIERERGEVEKGWTMYVLGIVHTLVGVIAIVEYFWLKRRLNYYVSLTGLILFTVAFLGRAWAVRTLGRYHSVHIEIREDQPLIKSGPYRYVRHPIYLCVILELLGFPLIPNSYFALLVALFVYVPILILRLFLEERALLKKFGEEYVEYKKKVPCIFPFLKGEHS